MTDSSLISPPLPPQFHATLSHDLEMIGKLFHLISTTFPDADIELLEQTLIFRHQLTKLAVDLLKAGHLSEQSSTA